MGIVRRLVPYSRVGMAVWAYRHRQDIADWAGHGVRSVSRLVNGEGGDVVAETRLRAALAADRDTKGAKGLQVSVRHGVAELRGRVEPSTALAAVRVAERIPGVRNVRDATAGVRSRR
ncbi:MAG TPA: BON domain-containing protein [Acidimicrobiales bacterium]|jgi:osmotically-inducible protein OsmY